MVAVTSNYKLNHIISLVREYISNNTYNVTEEELRILIKYINETDNDKFSENNNYESCGYKLRILAESYKKTYHLYFAIAVCLFGAIANILNVIVLSRKDMICTPINQILRALAVTDIMVMAEYLPYVCYYYMVLLKNLDFPFLGAIYMLFHAHVTQTLHTTSICLTVMLAVWRYLALSYPTRTHILCSQFRCTLGIATSYILSIILCLPTYFTISITSQEIVENKTRYILYYTDLSQLFKTHKFLLKLNFWIYAVFIKLLPCCILTIITCWLIHTLLLAKKRKKMLRNFQFFVINDGRPSIIRPRKMERRAERTTKLLIAVLFLFLLTELPQGIFAIFIGIQGKDLFLECYQVYGVLMDIFALFSGSVNFILYCFTNKTFRITFGQIFKRKILDWTASSFKPRQTKEDHRIEETET